MHQKSGNINIDNVIPGMVGNYTATAFQSNDTNAIEFRTKWTVPSKPQQTSLKTLFLWNALTPSNGGGVIQPVLAWGSFYMTNPKTYSYNEWYVYNVYLDDNGNYITTDIVEVQPGDEVEGVIQLLSTTGDGSNKKYEYQLSFAGEKFKNITTSFETKRRHNCPTVCFEPYTDNYLDLPSDNSVKMRSMNAKLFRNGQDVRTPLTWTFYNNNVQTPSNINGTIVSSDIKNGEIDFYFR